MSDDVAVDDDAVTASGRGESPLAAAAVWREAAEIGKWRKNQGKFGFVFSSETANISLLPNLRTFLMENL